MLSMLWRLEWGQGRKGHKAKVFDFVSKEYNQSCHDGSKEEARYHLR